MFAKNTTSRFSPVSSEAKAVRRGLPTRIRNMGLANIVEGRRLAAVPAHTHAGRYKHWVMSLKAYYKGNTLYTQETGKAKNRAFSIVGFDIVVGSDEIAIAGVTLYARPGKELKTFDPAITLTKHVFERLSQRHARLSKKALLKPVKDFYLLHKSVPPEAGKYEFGCGCGIFIVIRERFHGQLVLVTFVAEKQFNHGERSSLGFIRRIK